MTAKLDAQVRDRMSHTGETYEVAAKTIGDYNVERVQVVVWLRILARSYVDSGPHYGDKLIESLATRIENGDHLTP